MFFSSGFWKMQARAALRNHWLTALLIALAVNLPALLVQGIAAATGNDLMTRMTDAVYAALSPGGMAVDTAKLAEGLAEIQGSTGIWVMQGLNLAAFLLTPCLTIGMVHWLMMLLRKQPAGDVRAVFSRAGLFLKGIGLRLYVAWRVFLFMLPGLILSVAALLPVWLADSNSRISALSAVSTSAGLQSAALIATFVLGVIGALRYALGDMVLADRPETGPVQAAKESRRLTEGKRGMLFSLYASFIFWYLLSMMVVSLVMDLFGPVPGLMVEMLASLAITVYLHASVTAFYLACVQPRPAGGVETEENSEDIE